MPQPIHMLYVVMAIGVLVWPLLKKTGVIETTQETDLLVVVVLILSYVAYKKWWNDRRGA
jgi:hypothetical protein